MTGISLVATQLSDLDAMSRDDLVTLWRKAFKASPAKGLSLGFLRRVLAHHLQCQRHGGLPADTRRLLASLAAGKPLPKQSTASLAAGAHLVREWNGRTYQVEVIDGGYRFDGQTYRSLTAIARRITGTNWSGPRFFGLANRAQV